MFSSFTFNGISSKDMGLVLVSIDPGKKVSFGLNRDILKGEKTKYRPRSNHFGTSYSEDLEFDISIVKDTATSSAKQNVEFTSDDVRKINGWLTSPQFPKLFTIQTCEEYFKEPIEFFVIFDEIDTEYNGHLCMLTYHVTCDSPFGYTPEITHTLSPTVTAPAQLVVTNNSDEYEEYVYPRFEITPTATGEITIENVTDGHSMTFTAYKDNDVIWDCQKMQFKDFTGELLSFEDIGVDDVDNIYWFRLCYGQNTIKISGSATVKLIYREPRKVGAF